MNFFLVFETNSVNLTKIQRRSLINKSYNQSNHLRPNFHSLLNQIINFFSKNKIQNKYTKQEFCQDKITNSFLPQSIPSFIKKTRINERETLNGGIYQQFLSLLSKPQKKIYGGILAPCILFIIAFAQFNLSSEFSPLVPALKSNWLLMHVSIMIFSYTIFIVAGLISLILIIQKYY